MNRVSFLSLLEANPGTINHVRGDESLLKTRFDAAQTLLCLDAVAEIARTETEIRLRIGEINRDVGERPLKSSFHLFCMFQGLVADFHEDMDAVAAERTINIVK